jgi:hypothetical protein
MRAAKTRARNPEAARVVIRETGSGRSAEVTSAARRSVTHPRAYGQSDENETLDRPV